MAQYRITDTLLTRIANAVRRITGGSGKLSPSGIATALEDTSIVKTSGDTVSDAVLVKGFTAHDKDGNQIVGTIERIIPQNVVMEGAAPLFTYTATPSTEDKILLNGSGLYSGYSLYVKGDPNLIPENIVSGKSIFGVNGYFTYNTFRTGTSEPDSSLGSDGDWYLVTEE